MIGQQNNIEIIKSWRNGKVLPRFLMIHGAGERLELAKVFSKTINAHTVIVGKSVDEVRQVILTANKTTDTTVYIFEKGDEMSNAACNALLKVTEEPPNKAYFIVLYKSKENALETINSRATHLEMDPYTKEELSDLTTYNLILDNLRTPNQVREWLGKEKEFAELVRKCSSIGRNIITLTGVETLRVSQMVKTKSDGEGYDADLVVSLIYDNIDKSKLSFHSTIKIARSYLACIKDLNRNGVKKDSTIDVWMLGTRDIMRGMGV